MQASITAVINEFKIAGIGIRTTNANGKAQKDIGILWERFFGQNIINQISNKETNDIYCIYTDYESDFNGEYVAIIGCRVSSFDNITEELVSKTIAQSKYQCYKSTGKLPDCVIQTWNDIWQSSSERKYTADFDVYRYNLQNPENAEVDTFVSVK